MIIMKKIYFTLIALLASINMFAQGWPANYSGVMLQGFSWDSYDYSQWSVLEKQADDMKGFIDLVWLPQSGKCIETTKVMGYKPYYYFNQNSSFGTEAELRSLIAKFKANGIGAIADVVVNHRNTDGWFTFPAETYNGVTYQMLSTDICKNDDSGSTATQAKKDGVSLSNNYDEGTDFGGCRDIDHKSENLQKIIKAYLKFLKEDIGYTGFRYDMVKGFSGTHVADYNDAAGVEFSVGEYWDGNQSIINWINKTKKKSAAFDFQFRYNVRDAVGVKDNKIVSSPNWSKLKSDINLMHDPTYRQYAITFVENHDMQYRSKDEPLDPLKRDTLAANAYMLAMPGTPCVFQPHWRAYKQEIKSMIEARKLAGITNMSNYTNKMAQTACFANETTGGDKAKIIVVVGNNTKAYTPGTDYAQILEGYHYRYYLSKSAETAWCNIPSGEYEAGFKAKLTAVSQNSNAKLVYTTDGTAPTAKSKQVATGSNINIDETCTLKVGLLSNGTVTGIRTYNYTVKAFEPYTITVYANADQVTNWGSTMYFYAWNTSGELTEKWPGTAVTATKTLNGKKWYYMDFKIKSKDAIVNIIFNQGKDKKQSVDMNAGNSTKFYEITTAQSNGKYTCKDVTATWAPPTGITGTPTISNTTTDNAWYTLSGMKLGKKPAKSGVYIHQGKKVIIR